MSNDSAFNDFRGACRMKRRVIVGVTHAGGIGGGGEGNGESVMYGVEM